MSKNQSISSTFHELITTHLLPVLEEKINEEIAFCRTFKDTITPFEEKIRNFLSQKDEQYFLQTYQSLIYEFKTLLQTRYTERTPQSFHKIFEAYAEASDDYLNNLRKNRKETQKRERFISQPNDPWLIRFFKFWKRLSFQLSVLPVKVRNTARKFLKKDPLPEKFWSQIIPFRELTTLYFGKQLAFQMLPHYQQTHASLAKAAEATWKIEDQIFTSYFPYLNKTNLENEKYGNGGLPEIHYIKEIDAIITSLQESARQLKKSAGQEVNTLSDSFNEAIEKAGTMELTHRHINHKLIKQQKELDKAYEKSSLEWSNTLFALHEDWRIDQELNLLSISTFHTYGALQSTLDDKIIHQTIPHLTQATQCIKVLMQMLNKHGFAETADKTLLKTACIEGKQIIEKELIREILPNAIETLFKQQLPLIFDRLCDDFSQAVREISEERGLVGTKNYDTPIKSSDIDFVSPYQIVAFESLPNLLSSIQENKQQVSKELIQIQQRIHEIGQIAYFNLDSAISALSTVSHEGQSPFEIANQGLLRAIKSTDTISEDLIQIKNNTEKVLFNAINAFNQQLNDLKNNNYALEIKFRIARAKAIEQARAYREKLLTYLKNIVPVTFRFIRKTYRDALEILNEYQRKLGIETDLDSVTTEISDYLSATESAINRLPFVYQRLFKIQPLEDEIFFEERRLEMEVLNDAFEHWKNGRYSCAVLVGEKGSGLTTLINFFIKRRSEQDHLNYPLIFANANGQFWTEAHFFQFFDQTFPGNSFKSLEELAQYLIHLDQPHFIILEHIERLFLKKIGGFICLKLLFELISKTNRHIFWLSSSTLYSWHYLDKTLQVSGYFEYVIQLQNIANEKMSEVILKRHRVSGYGIRFLPAASEREKKKYNKMSGIEQQEFLKSIYFADLNRITFGNCSLALLFWMRSAEEVTDDTIIIGSLKNLDFSFIKSISLLKTIVLHILLLHDGLTEEQYAMVSNQLTVENHEKNLIAARLELLQLLDDGLIIKDNDFYYINPLLYRPIVNLLKTKNFLH